MKLFRLATVVATVAVIAAFLAVAWDSRPDKRMPRPASVESRSHQGSLTGEQHRELAGERRGFKQQRRDYFESLHRAAPDIDWRAMDRESRRRLSAERVALRRAMLDHGLDPSDQPVVLDKNARSVDGTWTEKGSNNLSGRMHLTTVHDTLIYAGSSGGIVWRGTLGGEQWTPLNDWLRMTNIVSVEVLPGVGGGDHRIVAYHDGDDMLHYSDDEGLSWQTTTGLEGPESWGSARRAELLGDPAQTLFLLAEEWNGGYATGFYRSGDHGASFQRLQVYNQSIQKVDMWCPPDESGPGYLLLENDLYSFDASGALTFVQTLPVTHLPSKVQRIQLRGRSTPAGADLYAAYAMDQGNTRVYSALSGGAVFAYEGTVAQTTFMINSFEVSQARAGELYLGGVDTYRSGDGGQTWNPVNYWYEYYDDPQNKLHADIPGIQVFQVDGQELALICTDGGVYASEDGLLSVDNISLSGMRISQYYDVYTNRNDDGVVYAGSQDQGFQRSLGDPGGLMDFEQTISGDYAHLVSGDGGASIWCVYPGFAMYYPDAVNSTDALFWDFTVSGQFWLPPLMADPVLPNRCWLGGGSTTGGAHLVALDASGIGISAFEAPYDFSGGGSASISAMAYSHQNTDTRYVMTSDGNFHYRIDNGPWQTSPAFTGPGSHYFHGASVVASPVDAGTVWIAGSGYSNPAVYVTDDHGLSFVPMDTGLPPTLVYMLAVSDDGQSLFAATELGPYAWDQTQQTWQFIAGANAPDQVYWCVEWVETMQTARFGTYGRGIWDFTIDDGTPVHDDVQAAPTFALRAAPNPFNPYSRVSFELERGGDVQLDLYDLRGAKVAEVFAGHLAAGVHARTLDGARLASGAYVLRLTAGRRHEELRVTLLK